MRSIGVLVYPNFELLDLFGPVEMFGWFGSEFEIAFVGPEKGPVTSNMGPATIADLSFRDDSAFDILLVPGGWGKSIPVETDAIVPWLADAAGQSEHVLTVCTGSALLALTGALDGRKATTNKALFGGVAEKRPDVKWQPKARWVRDTRFYSSSGVSAGMDMALAVIADLLGENRAEEVAAGCEYRWNRDPDDDPFSAVHGLT